MLHRVPLPGRLGTALSERRRATRRWIRWARSERPSGPLLWLHAASVGETIAAGPIVGRIRAVVPDIVVIHTFTSPSVAEWPTQVAADRSDYAPEDTGSALRPLFQALDPTVLMVSRGDLWPGMARLAERSGVPIAIVGATIRPDSRRLRWPVRNLLTGACRNLAFVGAMTDDDAERWRRIGAPDSAISVVGDPRDASVLERPMHLDTIAPLASWAEGRAVLVAGSTHPRDERVLSAAFTSMVRTSPDASLLIVPHDPNRRSPDWEDAPVECATWDGFGPVPSAPCVFVPIKGALADLYALGTLAYVGGAFDRGAHSVAEPAVFALPTAAGPKVVSSPEARRFVDAGAVTSLPDTGPADVLAAWWRHLLMDKPARWRVGLTGRAVLDATGARVNADAVLRLMEMQKTDVS